MADKQTLNPLWNAECDLIATNESVIAVQVFDQKKFKKESQGFLGAATFILGSFIDVNQAAPSTASALILPICF